MAESFDKGLATGDENLGLVSPESFPFASIPHYYGDAVRELLVGAAALMLLGTPFYPDLLSIGIMPQVAAAVIIAILAALTSPRLTSTLILDAVIAAIGLVVFESAAIDAYHDGSPSLFVLREALAVVFLFALYFSLKTVRSMFQHRVAHHHRAFIARAEAEAAEDRAEEAEKAETDAEEARERHSASRQSDFDD